jgi:hypothetical protein
MGVPPDEELLRAMQARATAVGGEFNLQDVANTLWAHACFAVPFGKVEQELFSILASRLLEVASKMEQEHECQVHQWLLTFDLESSWDLSSLAQVIVVNQKLGERCRRTFAVDPNPSKLQVALLSSHAMPSQIHPLRELHVTYLLVHRGTSPRRFRERFQIM